MTHQLCENAPTVSVQRFASDQTFVDARRRGRTGRGRGFGGGGAAAASVDVDAVVVVAAEASFYSYSPAQHCVSGRPGPLVAMMTP